MIRRIVLLTLALAACDSPTDSSIPVPGDVHVMRQVWERQGIDDYRYTFARDCFCERLGTVRVEVRNGQISDVRELESGQLVPQNRWQEIPTVDQFFDRIEQAQAQDQFTDVRYHRILGYPADATLGTLANDAGVSYAVRDLRRVN